MRISDWSSDVCSSDLSGQPNGVFERVDAGRFAAAVGEDFPARCPIAFWFDAPRVDAAHRALAAEAVGDVGDEFGTRDRGAVHRDLVGAREQPRARVVGAAHSAADGKRHRSEERRVGKECVSPCSSRWWTYHDKKKYTAATNI